jgi:hypothetical protein
MHPTPPRKRKGMKSGRRRLDGEVLDVAAGAELIGETEKATRSQIARGLLPYRRLGGRVVLLRSELLEYLRRLPGVTLAQALENGRARNGDAS